MPRARVDSSIQRLVVDGFDFPLGVYPIEPMKPKEGYTVHFESSDADQPPPGSAGDSGSLEDSEEFELWPDRYVYDIVIRAGRLESLCRSLFAILPGRIYPILDVLGNDAYREVDPYLAYELVGQEHFTEALRRYKGWFFEDGLVGFGAMSDEPFIYIFIDEHKIVTVRVEASLKPKIEAVLEAFDLPEIEKIAGADAAIHEHRSVLEAPADRPDLLCAEEIIEELRDTWGLQLNVDAQRNLDELGNELGVTPWRVTVRLIEPPGSMVRYAEVFLTADSLDKASEIAIIATEDLYASTVVAKRAETASALDDDDSEDDPLEADVLFADRMSESDFEQLVPEGKGKHPRLDQSRLVSIRWLE
ncbi:MAG: hypothetical protein IBJ18_08460 [Phycisphaerales bacterium]|nr:hypothetical protein [Phycisphaerales bacterium]